MQNVIAVAVVIVLLVPASWWVSHTRLVGARNDVAAGWADVDAELDRRHALVPRLVDAVHGATDHERDLLVELSRRNHAAASASHCPEAANTVEPPLAEAMRQVMALRERHPELDSQQSFLELQRQLAMIEDRIATSRRFYNTRVEALNRRIDALPSAWVARHHGFTRAEFFDA